MELREEDEGEMVGTREVSMAEAIVKWCYEYGRGHECGCDRYWR